MKLLLVVNPRAASGDAGKFAQRIQTGFAIEGLSTEFIISSKAGEICELITHADLSVYRGVVVAGGDGTVFEAVNGLMAHPQSERVPLGIVPVGTGNAFARDLGLCPGDLEAAAQLVSCGGVSEVDVAQVETERDTFYFINALATGFGVKAGRTAQRLKFLGRHAYSLGTLWQTLTLKATELRIEIDGEMIEQNNTLVCISNSRYTGTSFLIAPMADMSDGLLDVTLISALTRRRLLRLFPTIFSGRHINYPEVTTHRCRKVCLWKPGHSVLAPDGEFRGVTPAEISCIKGAIQVFASAK